MIYNWLTEKYEPKVIVHSNSEMSHAQFDSWLLKQQGYQKGDTIHYSIKQGKTTLLGNPKMHEGL